MKTTPSTNESLAGLGAVITGASGGIGGAIALALAARGVRLALLGRDQPRLENAASKARALGVEAKALGVDLTDDDALAEAVAAARRLLEGVDLLVHSAGGFHHGTVEATPVAELDRQLAINLRAPYRLSRLLLEELAVRRGQIVFVNSTAALGASAKVAAYAAAKAGLKAFADSLRLELNPRGVRVVTVFPGRTATAMQRLVRELEGAPYDPDRLLQPEDVAAAVVAALELPCTAEVTEIVVRPMAKTD